MFDKNERTGKQLRGNVMEVESTNGFIAPPEYDKTSWTALDVKCYSLTGYIK